MGVSTLGNTLAEVSEFEGRQIRFYADLSGRATDQGVVLMAGYLGRRNRHVPEAQSLYTIAVRDIKELKKIKAMDYF